MNQQVDLLDIAAALKKAGQAEQRRTPRKPIPLSEAFKTAYWDKFRHQNKSHDKQEAQMEVMIKLLNDPDIRDIKGDTISYLKSALRDRKIADSTVNRYLACLKSTLRWYQANRMEELVVPLISLNTKAEREREFIINTPLQEKMIRKAPEELKRLLMVLFGTGARISEILKLRYDYGINLASRSITIHSPNAKSGKARTIPMNDKVYQVFDSLKSDGIQPFPHSYHYYRLRFMDLKKKLGISHPDFCFHAIRHSVCTHLIEQGVDSLAVGRLVGHSSPQITSKYFHLSANHLSKCVDILNGI